MPHRRSKQRAVLAGAALVAPSLVLLGVLTAHGALTVPEALGFGAGVGVVTALAVYWALGGLLAFVDFVRGLADGSAPERPGTMPLAGDALRALQALRADWERERHTLQDALDAREALIESLPDPLLMLDAGRHVVRANEAAQDMLDGVGENADLAEVLRHPTLLEAVDEALLERPANIDSHVVEFDLPDSVDRYILALIRPLANPTPDGVCMLVSLHDLTAIRRAEQMRVDFVANASHELRTPIATLTGFIETLQGAARNDEGAREHFLAIMAEQADRMGNLVADLLSLSRIELIEHAAPSAVVTLPEVLASVVESLEMRARERGMSIDVALPDDLPPIAGDADQLAQVFQNLIDNAIKYARDGTPIRVQARAMPQQDGAPRMVTVSVVDQGEGVARHHIPRLTERFYRVDTARSRELGGTGLGLAIVKHIVSRHRGQMHIDSETGKGTTVSVQLPVAERRRRGKAGQAAAKAPPAADPKRVPAAGNA
jgi:two-component system phosphate regulon sensor histidine kinase PhoR